MNTTVQVDGGSAGRRAAHSPAFEALARIGLVARGVLYGTIGLLAIQVAIHSSNERTNQRGALETIEKQPFGHGLLIAVAIGLGGYALWRFTQAILGHGPEGGGDSSAMGRIVAVSSGVSYAAMCALAVSILVGASSQSSSSPHKSAAGVLAWPGGRCLVGAAGAIFIGVALYQGYKGFPVEHIRVSSQVCGGSDSSRSRPTRRQAERVVPRRSCRPTSAPAPEARPHPSRGSLPRGTSRGTRSSPSAGPSAPPIGG